MNRKTVITGVLGLIALLLVSAGIINAASNDRNGASGDAELMVEISITNLTRGQIMSPVFVARHDRSAEALYTLGQPASDALAAMAEDADASGLLTAWNPETNGSVGEAMVVALNDGPILPGQTVTFTFSISDGMEYVSLASMLVSTNDAFIGVSGLDVSTSGVINLAAYDSGSEANSEDCQYIPGPPCGNHAEDTADAEGFVHVHAGIHGGGGLDPAMHDWHNPTARLEVKTWKLTN